jgi:hypothetical protein
MPSRIADAVRGTVYLLVSFPLGVAYFVFVVAGVTVGVSLLLLVVGVFVLSGTASLARRVAVADAELGAWLFDTPVPSLDVRDAHGDSVEAALVDLTSLASYRALAYLLVRFVVGVGGFVVVVTWLALAGALLATPLLYDDPDYTVTVVFHTVETLPVALAVGAAGVAVALLGGLVVAAIGRAAARGSAMLLAFPDSTGQFDTAEPADGSDQPVDGDEGAVTDGERERE